MIDNPPAHSTESQNRDFVRHWYEFDLSWNRGEPIRIEDALSKAGAELAGDELLEGFLRIEVERRRAAGHEPTRSEYQERFEGSTNVVEAVFLDLESDEHSPHKLERLGDFRIIREIGRGGISIVYEAVQESLNRRIALKTLLLPHLAAEGARRMEIEAQAIAQLHHTNIVTVHGAGVEDGIHYLALQMIDGCSLDQALRENSSARKSPQAISVIRDLDAPGRNDWIAKIGLKVAEALAYSHEKGILHRDIKPSNLLVDEMSSEIWLSDFGLAKVLQPDTELTLTRGIVGTLEYMPPEALDAHWDERSDIYGLGATLYRLLTLRHVYRESDRTQLLKKIMTEDPRPIRQWNPKVPRDLETIVQKAMAREPERRYVSSAKLAEDLHRFLAREPIHARRPNHWHRFIRWTRREPIIALMSFALIASLIVGTIVAESQRRKAIARAEGEQIAREKADRHLSQSHLNRWTAATDKADYLDSLPWLLEAVRVKGTESIELGDRIRFTETLARLPTLEGIWSTKEETQLPARFTSDGRHIVKSRSKRVVEIIDLNSGISVGETFEFDTVGSMVELSPDGKLIAIGGGDSYAVWRISDGKKLIEQSELTGDLVSMFFNPEQEQLLISMHGGIHLMDLKERALVFPEIKVEGFGAPAALSRDGDLIIRSHRRWDASTGSEKTDHSEMETVIYDMSLSRDGSRVATSGYTFGVSDTISGASQFQWRTLASKFPLSGAFTNIDFCSDGRFVATGTGEGELIVIDLETQDLAMPILYQSSEILDVQFSPDGSRLAAAYSDGYVRILLFPSGREAYPPIPHEAPVDHIEFSPNGVRLLTTTHIGNSRVWNLAGAQGQIERAIADVTMVADRISPKGIGCSFSDGVTRLLDTTSWLPTDQEFVHDGKIAHIELSPDGKRVASVNADGRTRCWKVDSGQLEFAAGGRVRPYRVRFTPDSKRILLFYSTQFNLFDLETTKDLIVSESVHGWRHEGTVHDAGAAIIEDKNQIVIGASERLTIYDGSSGDKVRSRSFDNYLHPVAASADGDLVVVTPSFSEVALLTGDTLEPITRIPVRSPEKLAVSRDGDRLAVASSGTLARVYEVATGQPLSGGMRHQSVIETIEFLDFEVAGTIVNSLITTCSDGTLYWWNSETGTPLIPPMSHPGAITGLVVDSETRTIVTACEDNLGRVIAFPKTSDLRLSQVGKLVELLTLREIDHQENNVIANPSDLSSLWQSLQSSNPEYFQVDPSEISRWRRIQYEEALAGKQWHTLRFHLDRLPPEDRNNIEVQYQGALAAARLGHWSIVQSEAEAILESNPTHLSSLLLATWAKFEAASKPVSSIIADLEVIRQTSQSTGAVDAFLSLLYEREGRGIDAERAFAATVKHLGIIRFSAGQNDRLRVRRVNGEARKWWLTIQYIGEGAPMPKSPRVQAITALANGALDRWDDAVTGFSKVANAKPEHPLFQLCRLRAEFEAGELHHRSNPQSEYVVGQMHQSPEGFVGLDQLLQSELTYWKLKSKACFHFDQWTEALEACERAFRLGETDTELLLLSEEAKERASSKE